MKYEFIKRGQHMPKSTERLAGRVWVRYYKTYQWRRSEKNMIWNYGELRRPITLRKRQTQAANSQRKAMPITSHATSGRTKRSIASSKRGRS